MATAARQVSSTDDVQYIFIEFRHFLLQFLEFDPCICCGVYTHGALGHVPPIFSTIISFLFMLCRHCVLCVLLVNNGKMLLHLHCQISDLIKVAKLIGSPLEFYYPLSTTAFKLM